MPTDYIGNEGGVVYPVAIQTPSDGDARDAASVGVGLEALADRTHALDVRKGELNGNNDWTGNNDFQALLTSSDTLSIAGGIRAGLPVIIDPSLTTDQGFDPSETPRCLVSQPTAGESGAINIDLPTTGQGEGQWCRIAFTTRRVGFSGGRHYVVRSGSGGPILAYFHDDWINLVDVDRVVSATYAEFEFRSGAWTYAGGSGSVSAEAPVP